MVRLKKSGYGAKLMLLFTFVPFIFKGQVTIMCNGQDESIRYALSRWPGSKNIISFHSFSKDLHIDLVVMKTEDLNVIHPPEVSITDFEAIKPQGYRIKKNDITRTLYLLYRDITGLQYGMQDISGIVQAGKPIISTAATLSNPYLPNRIIKYNLPWSPYRNSEATTLHDSTCRDITYWEKFLDMMVDSRMNVLSLWSIHPFPFMIKSTAFPLANDYNDDQMRDWQSFWTALFHMAKVRGIETYMVNWNIAVSPQFAKAYHVNEYSDQSDLVKQYTKGSVTQVINEYPELTGLGVTLADWMGTFDEKMTPQQREDWIEETFVKGMKAADHPVKFIHRSVLAGDPIAMRHLIDKAALKDPTLVEVKFNWSHGHSTPTLAITHDYHSGKLDDRFWTPKPVNYDIQWMIRNEDFFILRWGQPDFIRQHIKANVHDYVNGYFIGSEGYIPAVDYSSATIPEKSWQYAFEKQWLYYLLWGRLLYDPSTPDGYFENRINDKYNIRNGDVFLRASALAGNMPLRLASFHRSTWDYTLYCEGFMEPEPSDVNGFFDRTSPFISIDEFIRHETLDPRMISIPDYVNKLISKEKLQEASITPIQLADASEQDSRQALKLFNAWTKANPSSHTVLHSEWQDIATWSYLGLYLADKLRAGVSLQIFYQTGDITSKQKAIKQLNEALKHWDQVIYFTKGRYKPTPHVALGKYKDSFPLFSWERLRDQVVRDIELAKNAKMESIKK